MLEIPCKCYEDSQCPDYRSKCVISVGCFEYRYTVNQENDDCLRNISWKINPYEADLYSGDWSLFNWNGSFVANITNIRNSSFTVDLSLYSQDANYTLKSFYVDKLGNIVEMAINLTTPCKCSSNMYCRDSIKPICSNEKNCISNVTFSLSLNRSLACHKLIVNAEVKWNISTDVFSNITWTIQSNMTNTTNLNALKDWMSSQSLSSFAIPGEYIYQEYSSFNLSCSFYQDGKYLKYSQIIFYSDYSCQYDSDCLSQSPFCIETKCYKEPAMTISIIDGYDDCGQVFLSCELNPIIQSYSFPYNWSILNNSASRFYDQLSTYVSIQNTQQFLLANYIDRSSSYNISVTFMGSDYKSTVKFSPRIEIAPNISWTNYSAAAVFKKGTWATLNSDLNLSSFDASWSLNSSLVYNTTDNQVHIYLDDGENFVNGILVTIKKDNSTHFICYSKTFLFLEFPGKLSFAINPAIGYSNYTQFFLNCSATHSSSILSYKLYQFNSTSKNWMAIGNGFSNTLNSTLISDINIQNFFKCEVTDAVGSINFILKTITIFSNPNSNPNPVIKTEELINEISNLISSGSSTQVISEVIVNYEEILMSNYDNKCPNCSSNGYCDQYSTCICGIEWTGQDCSLNVTEYNSYLTFKKELITQLDLTSMNSSTYVEVLKKFSDTNFNNEATMSVIQNKLDDFMSSFNNSTIPQTLLNATNAILDNLILWTSGNDCKQKTSVSGAVKNNLQSYVSKISDSALNYKTQGEGPSLYSTSSYTLYLDKVNACSAYTYFNLTESGFATNITSKSKSNNCTDYINIQYMALNPNLFNCSLPISLRSEGDKDLLSLKITSSSGTEITKNFAMELIGADECPSGCDSTAEGNCECDDLSIFDIKNQIFALFANSAIGKLADFASLVGWIFYQDLSFFLVGGLFASVSVATLLTIFKFSAVSLMSVKSIQSLGTCRRYIVAFMVNNTLLNAMFVKEEGSPKVSRIFLFFVKMMIMILFTAVFNFPENMDVKKLDVSFSFKLVFSISPYTFLLPYVTIIPYYNLLSFLLRKPPKPSRLMKFKIFFGIMLSIGTLAFCALGSFIISASKSSKQRLAWGLGIIFSCTQDLILNPLVFSFIQLLLIKFCPKDKTSLVYKVCKWLTAAEMYRIFETKKKAKKISRLSVQRRSVNATPKNEEREIKKWGSDTSAEDSTQRTLRLNETFEKQPAKQNFETKKEILENPSDTIRKSVTRRMGISKKRHFSVYDNP